MHRPLALTARPQSAPVFNGKPIALVTGIRGKESHCSVASGLCVPVMRRVHRDRAARHHRGVHPRPRSRSETAHRDGGAVQELCESETPKALSNARLTNPRHHRAAEAAPCSAVPEMSRDFTAVRPQFRIRRAACRSVGSVCVPTLPQRVRVPATNADAPSPGQERLGASWPRLAEFVESSAGQTVVLVKPD